MQSERPDKMALTSLESRVTTATSQLLAYCRDRQWSGYDPYDALNSRLFQRFPILDARLPRLVLTQALKRSPVNVRRAVLIPPTQNPKGLALFLNAALKLERLGVLPDSALSAVLLDKLLALRSPGSADWAWGYSFPWQTRTRVVPRGAANLVCTVFVVDALLNVYERTNDGRLLSIANSSADYILSNLYWTRDESAGLSYPMPGEGTRIHNANLLGAALFCRLHRLAGRTDLLDPALRLARVSVRHQREDGSWPYGELPTQSWVDNFHTGYNLGALRSIGSDLGTSEFARPIDSGYAFYRRHFFREDGAPRYFHDRTYPIDIHCVAQSLLTLVEFNDLDPSGFEQASRVFDWAMSNMWDERGFFYYRVLRVLTIRTSYMRWSQAWMLLALTTFLEACRNRRPDVSSVTLSTACA
jgi:hypothetical protein